MTGDYGLTIQVSSPNPDGTQSPIEGIALTHFNGAGRLTQRDFVETAGVPNVCDGNSTTWSVCCAHSGLIGCKVAAQGYNCPTLTAAIRKANSG